MSELQISLRRFVAQMVVGALLVAQLIVLMPGLALANVNGNGIVISQIQIAGDGDTAATDEFVELYNPTAATVSLTGWKLTRLNSAGTEANLESSLRGSISPHGYFLIAHSDYNGTVLADDTYSASSNPIGNNYTVILYNSSEAIVDKVGFGASTDFETAPFPTNPDNNQSVMRRPNSSLGNGTDTDDNSSDFLLATSATPRNSATAPRPLLVPTLTLLADDLAITANWNAVSSVTSYDINITPTGTDFTDPNESLQPSNLTKTFSGLVNGTSYDVRLRAVRDEEVSAYVIKSITPVAPTPVPVSPIQASVVYRSTTGSLAATHFGITTIQAEITTIPADALSLADSPSLTITRPGMAPQTLALIWDSTGLVWKTQNGYVITKANSPQDGTVTASVNTLSGKSVVLIGGGSFTVDTKVSKPAITVFSRCPNNQDSFITATDNDVVRLYVYKSADTSLANLVAVTSVNNGKVDEIYIGDNLFSALYVVAQDATGNLSDVTPVANDISSPDSPSFELVASDARIKVSWNKSNDNSLYVLRWRPVNSSNWNEKITTNTTEELIVSNEQEYEVALATRDASCNTSVFASSRVTTHTPIVLAYVAPNDSKRQNNPKVAALEAKVLAEAIMVAEEKDGTATPQKKSALTAEEDKDQNGVKDSDEDKNSDGVKDGQEPAKKEETSPPQVKDRSRLIVGIAALLILAGTAIAAYSWYQGADDNRPLAGDTPKESTDDKTAAAKTTKKDKPKSKRGGQKSRKRTRW